MTSKERMMVALACRPFPRLGLDRELLQCLLERKLAFVEDHMRGAAVPHLNGCDVSETLSPPGIGGDIGPGDRAALKAALGAHLALVGGLDQNNILGRGPREAIASEVEHLFSTFGRIPRISNLTGPREEHIA